jgi:hypothetical protein
MQLVINGLGASWIDVKLVDTPSVETSDKGRGLDGLKNGLEGRMFDNREGLARLDNPFDERLLHIII